MVHDVAVSEMHKSQSEYVYIIYICTYVCVTIHSYIHVGGHMYGTHIFLYMYYTHIYIYVYAPAHDI